MVAGVGAEGVAVWVEVVSSASLLRWKGSRRGASVGSCRSFCVLAMVLGWLKMASAVEAVVSGEARDEVA